MQVSIRNPETGIVPENILPSNQTSSIAINFENVKSIESNSEYEVDLLETMIRTKEKLKPILLRLLVKLFKFLCD